MEMKKLQTYGSLAIGQQLVAQLKNEFSQQLVGQFTKQVVSQIAQTLGDGDE